MAMPRNRQKGNPDVGIETYKVVLLDWMSSFNGSITHHLGHVAENKNNVTPAHVVKISPLLSKLIDVGCHNAMVLPTKLETGARQALAMHPGIEHNFAHMLRSIGPCHAQAPIALCNCLSMRAK